METLTSAWEQEGQARAALADKRAMTGLGCRMLWSRVPSPSCWLQGDDASLGSGAIASKEGARYPQQQDEQLPWDISFRPHLRPASDIRVCIPY